ncbi:hypothetical protein IQ268_09480 [Oculatella sp. LEGE 06141]|nr:hypothetical protein [Oculatella sp. LEGE 06141]MBE9178789.1 hypothetical protein [Oculatella sp. LEGE 06141]
MLSIHDAQVTFIEMYRTVRAIHGTPVASMPSMQSCITSDYIRVYVLILL